MTPALAPDFFVVSPNGQTIAARDETGTVALFSIDGQAPRPLSGERRRPIHWTADGRELFLAGREFFPAQIYRRDLSTGRVEPLRTISPADPTGVMLVAKELFSVDGRVLVYQYSRGLNDLYLARDLR